MMDIILGISVVGLAIALLVTRYQIRKEWEKHSDN